MTLSTTPGAKNKKGRFFYSPRRRLADLILGTILWSAVAGTQNSPVLNPGNDLRALPAPLTMAGFKENLEAPQDYRKDTLTRYREKYKANKAELLEQTNVCAADMTRCPSSLKAYIAMINGLKTISDK